ncbi:MAG: PEP-CTERM system histidine kinase PrsK [Azoarcus sp.]|jgi:putative PEP-CTERM system histidine kinase|nr:PEP-CTERM system histidine kinase PrsK [Azoarcus sp.]
MNESLALADFASWGYSLTAVVYAGFALYLYAAWRGAVVGGYLLLAVCLSCIWALSCVWYAQTQTLHLEDASESAYLWMLTVAVDVLCGGSWFAFLLVLLRPLLAEHWCRLRNVTIIVLGLQAVGVLLFVGIDWFRNELDIIFIGHDLLPNDWAATVKNFANKYLILGGSLSGAILGLVLIEQLYRSISQDVRWLLKPICMGLGAVYIFELYLFADAFLFGHPSPVIWIVRGPAHALVVPLLAISAARNPSWSLRISLSHSAVFHTAALGLCGGYLIAVAVIGWYVRKYNDEWGQALQLILLFAALVLLTVFMSSPAQRAKLRVFLNKHLFLYRYDYRIEWLRFTRSLSTANGQIDLAQAVISALANLVESPAGVLWLRTGVGRTGDYAVYARFNHSAPDVSEPADSALLNFMLTQEWIINLEEYRRNPSSYSGLIFPDWLAKYFPDAWLLIPLIGGTGVIGFVLLSAPRTRFEVNWEVRDLLKTAQHQAASDLERMLVIEDLLEARKFESFTRMSAFVVHDLKNLVAQLSLMLRNAERHKDNPEFQADMLETVAHVEAKMRRLMAQLQEKRSIDPARAINLAQALEKVRFAKRDARPVVQLDISPEAHAFMVLAHSERLERVIGHIVQNAVEATSENGSVNVTLVRVGKERARIVVEDTGCGMSQNFIRAHLSRPFETTKTGGMGIGVFETRQYIRELGGEVLYESTEGVGTRVVIELPAQMRPDVEQKEGLATGNE